MDGEFWGAFNMVADRDGDVFAGWTDYNGTVEAVYVNRFVPGFGWTGAVQLNVDNWAYGVRVATDPNGNAFAAWHEWNGSAYSPHFSRYTRDWGWSAPVAVEGNYTIGYQYETYAAMDGAGTGYYFVRYNNGTANRIIATRMDANGTVDPFVGIDPDGATSALAVAGDPRGGVFAAWTRYNGTAWDVLVVRYTPGIGWGPAVSVDGPTTGGTSYVTLGVDDSGNALAVWAQAVGGSSIQSAFYWANYGWQTPVQVAVGWNANYPAVAMNPAGIAVVVFRNFNGSAYVPAAVRFGPKQEWQTPVRSNDSMLYNALFSVAIDAAGNAFAAFRAPSPSGLTSLIRGEEFTGLGWGTPDFVQEPNSDLNVSSNPFVANLGRSGQWMVGWQEYNATFSYFARVNRYTALDRTPPWVVIDYPYDGVDVAEPYVHVYGYAEPGSSVNVNGVRADVLPGGNFDVLVPINRGGNWIRAAATDAAGNTAWSNWRYVFSTDPQPLVDFEQAQAGRLGWQDVAHMDKMSYWGAWWPLIKSDRNGNVFLLWYEWVGDSDHAYVSRYSPGKGWSIPMELQGQPGYLWGNAHMAVDDGGNATIMWAIYNYTYNGARIYAMHFSAEWNYWFGPYRVDEGRYSFWPDVAVQQNGRMLMTWQQRNETSGVYDIWARWYYAPLSWSGATKIESFANTSDVPLAGFDDSGDGVVTMRTIVAGAYALGVSRYNAAAGTWDGGTVVQTVPNTLASRNPVAVDARGNVTIAWMVYVPGPPAYYQYWTSRYFPGSGWTAPALLWNDSWNWDPEVLALDDGSAFVAFTATAGGTANAYAARAAPGAPVGAAVLLDNLSTNGAGGPRLSLGWNGTPVRVHFDEYAGGKWRPEMREWNPVTGNWTGVTQLWPDSAPGAHIPVIAPMPDGGFMVAVMEEDPNLYNQGQAAARRYIPGDTTPPNLTVTAPANGATVATATVHVQGTTDPGVTVTVNGASAFVAANGSFGIDVALVNGTNPIAVVAVGPYGNTARRWLNVTYDDPDRRRIEELEAENAALQQQLQDVNNTLWQALADQNASLLAQIADTNASLLASLAAQNAALTQMIGDLNATLLAELAAQNASLLQQIADLDASLLAELAAQNASLLQAIADLDASLLAEMAAQNADLLQAIGDLNASLLADLAAQNDALLAEIAQNNATLFAALAAQNTSLLSELNELNASLLASLAAGDASLAQLIASTNSSLLAALAAQNATLTASIAATNTSLLAALAAQNDDLLALIGRTNASLLEELARTNETLWAKLTADNGALWASLNASRADQRATEEGLDTTNDTLEDTQGNLAATTSTAQGASTMALLGVLIAAAAIGVALVAFMRARKGNGMNGMSPTAVPPPVGHVEIVHEAPPAPPKGGGGRGASKAAESEMPGAPGGPDDEFL
jgi:hypothetical protein